MAAIDTVRFTEASCVKQFSGRTGVGKAFAKRPGTWIYWLSDQAGHKL
jgi:hypothetical protein